jgi:hypothetical protein
MADPKEEKTEKKVEESTAPKQDSELSEKAVEKVVGGTDGGITKPFTKE